MIDIENNPIWKQTNASESIFLIKLFEPRDNALDIALEEARTNKANPARASQVLSYLPDAAASLKDAELWPIEPTEGCKVFVLKWKNYVSYNVTEEMHGSCGKYDNDKYTGRLLRIYTSSNYLDFTAKDTGAHFEPYNHYKIACLNHIIDVVSVAQPEITALSRKEARLAELI